jgi:peptidase M15-like protein
VRFSLDHHPLCIATALACALIALSAGVRPRALAKDAIDPKTASFAIAFHDEISAYRETAAFVMPGERLTIRAVGGKPGTYRLRYGSVVLQSSSRTWEWAAPNAPGTVYDLSVDSPSEHDTIVLHAFVMVPATELHDGILNGYRIGSYPATPLKGNKMYLPPTAFIEVTRRTDDAHLTPHFRLRQFVCKEGAPEQFPKYLVLKERLLLKLEAILEEVNALGFHVETLHVMSGYRTPYYNHAIGDVLYSMHQWGSAADIYIDKDDKNRMDDLNGDGRVDVQDARYLYDNIDRWLMRQEYWKFEGGLGFYPATPAHPPFVHLDVRGTRARWAW